MKKNLYTHLCSEYGSEFGLYNSYEPERDMRPVLEHRQDYRRYIAPFKKPNSDELYYKRGGGRYNRYNNRPNDDNILSYEINRVIGPIRLDKLYDFSYGVFSPNLNKYGKEIWDTELNIVSWGEGQASYDLRAWSPEHNTMSKGLRFSINEIVGLTFQLVSELSYIREHFIQDECECNLFDQAVQDMQTMLAETLKSKGLYNKIAHNDQSFSKSYKEKASNNTYRNNNTRAYYASDKGAYKHELSENNIRPNDDIEEDERANIKQNPSKDIIDISHNNKINTGFMSGENLEEDSLNFGSIKSALIKNQVKNNSDIDRQESLEHEDIQIQEIAKQGVTKSSSNIERKKTAILQEKDQQSTRLDKDKIQNISTQIPQELFKDTSEKKEHSSSDFTFEHTEAIDINKLPHIFADHLQQIQKTHTLELNNDLKALVPNGI